MDKYYSLQIFNTDKMNTTKNEPCKEMASGHYKLQLHGREQREHTLK